ncbi:zf-HC2 domain-containing protein [Dactylosporangium salmoneum]|uniref:Putative zinc-finger domain-containing protein n=1 Tax=Dactylosporangium salmoneum TaxID=53361 RepID=A0ABN3HUV4_9ACTN
MTEFGHGAAALYLLGALDPVREHAFERHLASCRTCQRECDEFGPVATELSRLPDHEVAALLASGTVVPPRRRRRFRLWWR